VGGRRVSEFELVKDSFKAFLIKRGLRASTVYRHLIQLRCLFKHSDFSKEEIQKYLDSLILVGRRNSYINVYVDTIRVFGQLKNIEEFKTWPYLREHPTIKSTLSDGEIEALLNLPPVTITRPDRWGHTITYSLGARNYERWTLFFSILAFTGMRPGEVAHLTISDVDFGQGVFVIRPEICKTNTLRYVPIPPNLAEKLKAYVSALKTNNLFQSSTKEAVFDNVDWHYNFQQRIKRLGIKRPHLTCYSLRHSFITRCLEEDINIHKIAKIAGHDISMTAKYEHLVTKDLKEAIKKLPLIRRSTCPLEILQALISTIKSFALQADKRFEYRFLEEDGHINLDIKTKLTNVASR